MGDSIDVSDKTKFAMPIRNLISLIASVAVGVWAYFGIIERLNRIETNNILMQADLVKNTEFRIKWPRGDLGSLPADAEQFEKRLAAYQAAIKQLEETSLTFVPYTTREALPNSKAGQEPRVVFQNELERVVKYWYVAGEDQKLYGELQPGERRVQETFASHVWLITDQQDKPLGYFVSNGVSATAKIVPRKPADPPK